MRNTLFSVAVATAFLGIAGASAQAQMLNGSLPLAAFGVSQDGSNLSTSTTINSVAALTSGVGAGDYAPIPVATSYNTTPLSLANPTTFSISNALFGSFVSTSFVVVMHTASNYDVELFGAYTPGPGLPGKITTNGELRVSINQSGTSLSEAITLSTPPADTGVPEPGSIAMLSSMGLTGAGFLMRRRK